MLGPAKDGGPTGRDDHGLGRRRATEPPAKRQAPEPVPDEEPEDAELLDQELRHPTAAGSLAFPRRKAPGCRLAGRTCRAVRPRPHPGHTGPGLTQATPLRRSYCNVGRSTRNTRPTDTGIGIGSSLPRPLPLNRGLTHSRKRSRQGCLDGLVGVAQIPLSPKGSSRSPLPKSACRLPGDGTSPSTNRNWTRSLRFRSWASSAGRDRLWRRRSQAKWSRATTGEPVSPSNSARLLSARVYCGQPFLC